MTYRAFRVSVLLYLFWPRPGVGRRIGPLSSPGADPTRPLGAVGKTWRLVPAQPAPGLGSGRGSSESADRPGRRDLAVAACRTSAGSAPRLGNSWPGAMPTRQTSKKCSAHLKTGTWAGETTPSHSGMLWRKRPIAELPAHGRVIARPLVFFAPRQSLSRGATKMPKESPWSACET